MVTLMGLLHFHLAGHQAIPVVGSATGMIGDPSGRSTERAALEAQELAQNVSGIEAQLQRFFVRGAEYAAGRIEGLVPAELQQVRVLRNGEWYSGMGVLEFLGNVGRHARIGMMMARDSVRTRLQSEQGISFTEFSYQLLQAYDFWYLYRHHGCRIQVGGSDQWGNITAGTDLIHRMCSSAGETNAEAAYGLTIPLLTTASGAKFGKSAGNALWLDEKRTSAFDVYQFFVRTTDGDVEKHLKQLTLLPLERISQTMVEHARAPERFLAQRLLAAEVTELLHGAAGVRQAKCATEVLFGAGEGGEQQFTAQDFAQAFAGDRRMVAVARTQVAGLGIDAIAVLAGACKSKAEAARLARGGGLYWNGRAVSNSKWEPCADNGDFVGGGTIGVIRTGKANHRVVRIVD
ncbi:Nucleotidylyl transferase [Coemansia reversa NRRL 1564]|uniref:Tyrosine--tRNA ligase n=1 Tax=Coemansia reversa (strain ATCC 12441 / NRRL 1564) TaxID=763665 RepID=A0A2G5BC24_COERN|nr:Nucleotidylyl transferase [Coemansia reversa NRRL 1564]|eukprot:PIA16569.1 Nucleotidylyl transferase [Coemansia reversa NRRL 1564]